MTPEEIENCGRPRSRPAQMMHQADHRGERIPHAAVGVAAAGRTALVGRALIAIDNYIGDVAAEVFKLFFEQQRVGTDAADVATIVHLVAGHPGIEDLQLTVVSRSSSDGILRTGVASQLKRIGG